MIIYKITNLINGKIYIGQDSHNNPNYFGSGETIKKSIKKHGKENFRKDIIEYCYSREELNEREIYWIKTFNAIDKKIGYNIQYGGNSGYTNNYKKGRITKDEYDKKLKEMKEKQHDIDMQLREHTSADENYYITVATVLNLAKRAKQLFMSSETDEKRAILNYLLQNCVANGKKLEFTMRSPFNTILELANQPTVLPWLDALGTLNWGSIKSELQFSGISEFKYI